MKYILSLMLALLALPAVSQQFNQRAAISTNASGATTIVAGVTGKRTVLYGIDVFLATSTTLQLKCGSTNLTGAMTATVYQKPLTQDPGYWTCGIGEDLVLSLGSGVQASGTVWYSQR